jgi:hypothetical protein
MTWCCIRFEWVGFKVIIYRDGIQWVYVATVRVSERREGVHAFGPDDLVLHTKFEGVIVYELSGQGSGFGVTYNLSKVHIYILS